MKKLKTILRNAVILLCIFTFTLFAANEIHFYESIDSDYYVNVIKASDYYFWDTVAGAYAQSPTWANSAIDATESTHKSGLYFVDLPTSVAGSYDILVYNGTKATATSADTYLKGFDFEWSGTSEIRLSDIVDSSGRVDVGYINGDATNGNNATLRLKQFNIQNDSGDAVYIKADGDYEALEIESTGNQPAVEIKNTGVLGHSAQGLKLYSVLNTGAYISGENYGLWIRGSGMDGEGLHVEGSKYGVVAKSTAISGGIGFVCTGTSGGKDIDADEIDDVKIKTDQLDFTGGDVKATLDSETVTVGDKTGFKLASDGLTGVTITDAIKAKTDNLPADPADDSDLDTQLAAIAVKTDLLSFTGTDVKATLDSETVILGSVSLAAIADAVLDELITDHDTTDSLGESLQFLNNIAEGDSEFVTTSTPWKYRIKHKTTGVVLVEKDLYDKDGNPIISVTTIIGRHTEP